MAVITSAGINTVTRTRVSDMAMPGGGDSCRNTLRNVRGGRERERERERESERESERE
jgi:hypothetical protein